MFSEIFHCAAEQVLLVLQVHFDGNTFLLLLKNSGLLRVMEYFKSIGFYFDFSDDLF